MSTSNDNTSRVFDYIERRDGGLWASGTRVSLDSIVYAFRNGQSAESIAQSNRPEIDAHLERGHEDYERHYRASRNADRDFYKRIEHATAAEGLVLIWSASTSDE